MRQVPLRIVLLRPHHPDNVGAVARAMKNFAVRDWALVSPGFDDLRAAHKLAVHATEVVDEARVVQSLDEVISDCVWVVGTSSRAVRGKRRLSPRAAARELVERSTSGPVAIVFGDERSGMTNEDVDRCHALSSVPAEDEQPSLNLAQAVLLYCYEVHQALLEREPPPPAKEALLASDVEVRGLEEALERTLRDGGFLVDEGRHAVRDLMAPMGRSRLSRHEARLWRAALEALDKRLGKKA